MRDDVAGVCADLESIATRFENEEDRINTDDLMAAIDHTDTLLEALATRADAAGIPRIHPTGFETFAALELGRAAIDWPSLLRGTAELFEQFATEAASHNSQQYSAETHPFKGGRKGARSVSQSTDGGKADSPHVGRRH